MRKVIGWTGIILILLAVAIGYPCVLWGISWTSVLIGIFTMLGVIVVLAVIQFFIYLIE